MTQEEYSARNAQINAEHKKKQLQYQQALRARSEQLEDLSKNYQEEKAKIQKAIWELKVQAAAATAEAASKKAELNEEYVASLKAGGYTGDGGPGPETVVPRT